MELEYVFYEKNTIFPIKNEKVNEIKHRVSCMWQKPLSS